MDDQLLTPKQVAKRLQISVLTVTSYLRRGELNGIKIGRYWRIKRDDLDAFIRARSVKSK